MFVFFCGITGYHCFKYWLCFDKIMPEKIEEYYKIKTPVITGDRSFLFITILCHSICCLVFIKHFGMILLFNLDISK